ncbi:hypothetical protein PFISCL1PPCAC_26575, partial [Pristionchus fissidentatus]
ELKRFYYTMKQRFPYLPVKARGWRTFYLKYIRPSKDVYVNGQYRWARELSEHLIQNHSSDPDVQRFFMVDSCGVPLHKDIASYDHQDSGMKHVLNYDIRIVIDEKIESKSFMVTPKYRSSASCLKMVWKEPLHADAEKRELIQRELLILKSSDHPFITPLRHSFSTARALYLITPHYTGGSLFNACMNGPLNSEAILFYASSIALGLEYLHAKRFIYTNLSMSTVLLSHDGYPVLSDFSKCITEGGSI